MTPEERAAECLVFPKVCFADRRPDAIFAIKAPPDIEVRIAAAIRVAVAEEREACADLIEEQIAFIKAPNNSVFMARPGFEPAQWALNISSRLESSELAGQHAANRVIALEAEVEQLRAMNLQLVERVAAQSELLSRAAMRDRTLVERSAPSSPLPPSKASVDSASG